METILRIRKDFGHLREIIITDPTFSRKEDNPHFFAKRITEKCWQNYGNYNENTITMFLDGNTTPIKINDTEFSPNVKDINFFLLSRPVGNHTYTISGRDSKGRLFEKEFKYNVDECLPGIIYCMIFIAYINDIEKAAKYWDQLQGNDLNTLSVGQLLDFVNEMNDLAKIIIPNHPYIELFMQNKIESLIKVLKGRLDELSILNK